jgi:hypothetical protein
VYPGSFFPELASHARAGVPADGLTGAARRPIVFRFSSDIWVVDHRREPRLKINKAVTLSVVSLMGEPSVGTLMNARVLDTSGSGMRLEVALPVPCGAEVVIEDQRMRILGETMRCDPKSDGYIVAVRVSETGLLADA